MKGDIVRKLEIQGTQAFVTEKTEIEDTFDTFLTKKLVFLGKKYNFRAFLSKNS